MSLHGPYHTNLVLYPVHVELTSQPAHAQTVPLAACYFKCKSEDRCAGKSSFCTYQTHRDMFVKPNTPPNVLDLGDGHDGFKLKSYRGSYNCNGMKLYVYLRRACINLANPDQDSQSTAIQKCTRSKTLRWLWLWLQLQLRLRRTIQGQTHNVFNWKSPSRSRRKITRLICHEWTTTSMLSTGYGTLPLGRNPTSRLA